MPQRRVPVPVAVRALGHRLVPVVVMPIVVPVRVFVLQRLVRVLVAVRLGQVQHHAGQHQRAAQRHPAAGRAVAQRQRQRRADEGREGEDRTGARRAEGTLRQQVEAQAQAVAGGADGEQAQRRRRRRQRLAEAEAPAARWPRRRARPWPSPPGSGRVRPGRATSVLSTPQAAVATATASRPHSCVPPPRCWSSTSTMAAGQQQRHRCPDAPVHRLVVQPPGQHGGEQRLQRQHQRRTGAAGALQAPGQRHRADDRAEDGHRQQPRQIATQQARLAIEAAGATARRPRPRRRTAARPWSAHPRLHRRAAAAACSRRTAWPPAARTSPPRSAGTRPASTSP